jgi:hypothetical protein
MGQPIVDLATLDLSRAVVPDAEQRTCLPHRHEFQLLDGICHFDPERGIAVAWKEWDAEPWWARAAGRYGAQAFRGRSSLGCDPPYGVPLTSCYSYA